MWPCQHKKNYKQKLLWLKLFSICLFLHWIILIWIFFLDHNRSAPVSISLHNNLDYAAPIIFVPRSQQTVTTAITQPLQTKPTPIPKKTDNVRNQKKTIPATSLCKQIETTGKKECLKIATPLQKNSNKPDTNDTRLQNQSATQKTVAHLKSNTVPTQKENITPQKMTQPEQQKAPQAPRFVPNNARISHDYREAEILKQTAMFQKELITHWKIPVGISKKASCTISFSIDNNGLAKNIAITKSSGILMYDLSARHALFAIRMPRWTYGKTFTINFQQ